MTHVNKHYYPGSIFIGMVQVLLLLTILLLVWGLAHKSETHEIFNRYSLAYFGLLLAISGVAGWLAWLAYFPSPGNVRFACSLFLVVGSSVISLGTAELALRVINPWGIELFRLLPYHMQGMLPDKELGYVHPPSFSYSLGNNRVSLNSHGLRGEEVAYEKPLGEHRVLVLGDSVAFGWGVDQGETFSVHLEPLLRQSTGQDWRVINSGVNGYNSEQESTYLRLEGMKFKPDIVILAYVLNDVDPKQQLDFTTTWRRKPTWPESLPEALNRLRQSSVLYQTVNLVLRMKSPPKTNTSGSGSYPSITESPGWPRSYAAIRDIAEQCRSAHVKLLVASEGISDLDTKFFENLRELDIKVISMDIPVSELPVDQQSVSRLDAHPSAAAHRKIAEHIFKVLQTRAWL